MMARRQTSIGTACGALVIYKSYSGIEKVLVFPTTPRVQTNILLLKFYDVAQIQGKFIKL